MTSGDTPEVSPRGGGTPSRRRAVAADLCAGVALVLAALVRTERAAGAGSETEFEGLVRILIPISAFLVHLVIVVVVRTLVLLPSRGWTFRNDVVGRAAWAQVLAPTVGVTLATGWVWEEATSGRYVDEAILAGPAFLGAVLGAAIGTAIAVLVTCNRTDR